MHSNKGFVRRLSNPAVATQSLESKCIVLLPAGIDRID